MFSWEERSSEARRLQAGKIPNPEIDVRFYRLGVPRANRESNVRRTRVMFSQVFELGGKRRKRVELAESEQALAGWDYEARRVEVATVVAGRFVAVVGAQLQAEALRQFVEYNETMRERVLGLVETGAIRRLEVHSIARQLGLSRIELQRADAELRAARYRLSSTWGGGSPRFAVAVGDLEPLGTIPDVETVIGLARDGPAVARWSAELERARASMALARSSRVPDLELGAGVRWEEDVNGNDYIVDLEIPLPIFDRKQGDVRAARSDMARAEAAREQAETVNREAIAEIYYSLSASEGRARVLATEVLPAARAVFEAHGVGFDRLGDNLDDLLDARRDLARTEVQYVEALVGYHQALATLEGLVGYGLVSE
jgi:cobalt-zinc-cadmium efflux system outer membrane protein